MTSTAPSHSDTQKSSGIGAAFHRARDAGRTAMIPFITVGYPDLATSEEIAMALVDAGADLLEVAVPFSDPAG